MNLHIVPDNVFINKFYENLKELHIEGNNRIVVRTNVQRLTNIKHELPFAPLYTRDFEALTRDTSSYQNVFIHQFTPLLYRWVAKHHFNNLGWMVWGADLYNLPSVHAPLYEELTRLRFIERQRSIQDFLYRVKVRMLHNRFRKEAYEKVDYVLTWMTGEYKFATQRLAGLTALHKFFFYENNAPYQVLDEMLLKSGVPRRNNVPIYVLGNSATPELNHLDVVDWMEREKVKADLWVPVSYGNKAYARFLKANLSFYTGGEIRFLEKYMPFDDYLQVLNQSDGLIMNNIRPQGYGNVLMMMYLGKKVFLNSSNLSIADLDARGLQWHPIQDLKTSGYVREKNNRLLVSQQLSHELLLEAYRELFS